MANVSHSEMGSNPFVIRSLGSPLESARLIFSDASWVGFLWHVSVFIFRHTPIDIPILGRGLADKRLKTKAEIFRLTEHEVSSSLS